MKPTIKLKSPLGTTFICKWRGDTRSKNKSIGRYKRPKLKGEVVQDMDVNATEHSMSIYIDGKDYIKNGQKFWKACDENGTWQIEHPVKGTLKSQQLISITENINTIDEGGFLKYDLQFIEATDPRTALFTQSFDAVVSSLRSALRTSTIRAFSGGADLSSSSGRIELTDTASGALSTTDSTLSEIYTSSDTVNSTVAYYDIVLSEILTQPDFSIDDYANALFDYINATAIESTTSIDSSGNVVTSNNSLSPITIINNYTKFIEEILTNIPPANVQGGGKNTALSNELITVAALCAMSQTLITAKLKTQAQALTLCDLLYNLFLYVRETLDDYQELFDDNFLEYRYFSQTESYYELAQLITNTCKYLREQSFSLKKEKRTTLKEAINTIVYVIEEYGELGENQENYDLFIDSNNLCGLEILQLPAGKEVLVYV